MVPHCVTRHNLMPCCTERISHGHRERLVKPTHIDMIVGHPMPPVLPSSCPHFTPIQRGRWSPTRGGCCPGPWGWGCARPAPVGGRTGRYRRRAACPACGPWSPLYGRHGQHVVYRYRDRRAGGGLVHGYSDRRAVYTTPRSASSPCLTSSDSICLSCGQVTLADDAPNDGAPTTWCRVLRTAPCSSLSLWAAVGSVWPALTDHQVPTCARRARDTSTGERWWGPWWGSPMSHVDLKKHKKRWCRMSLSLIFPHVTCQI